MTKKLALLAAGALVASAALPMQASAELEELQVHGQIRIRGNYITPSFASRNGLTLLGPENFGFDDDASNDDFYNALVEINFTADMSDDVTGYIALRSYDIWGVDDVDDSQGAVGDSFYGSFGGLLTGGTGVIGTRAPFTAGLAGAGNDTVGLYQAYILMENVGGYPIAVKIGRQEISLGREFLIGNNDASADFVGNAFDALRVDYDNDETLRVTAFTAKLVDNRNLEEDADVDLYAIYGTYYGMENVEVDAYWIMLRNAAGAPVNSGGAPAPVVAFNSLGDEVETLHTIGMRGEARLLDDALYVNAEFAYQFGQVDTTGAAFAAIPTRSMDVEAFALNLLARYSFQDVVYEPEVHAEYAFFSGDDDNTDGDYDQFTRLFSDVHYGKANLGGLFDEGTTNAHIVRIGASAAATDQLTLHGDLLFFWVDEDSRGPGNFLGGQVFGSQQFAVSLDDYAGTELDLWATWQYSEDLVLAAGWTHFFTDEAAGNAFASTLAGQDEDDLDYLWWQAHLVF